MSRNVLPHGMYDFAGHTTWPQAEVDTVVLHVDSNGKNRYMWNGESKLTQYLVNLYNTEESTLRMRDIVTILFAPQHHTKRVIRTLGKHWGNEDTLYTYSFLAAVSPYIDPDGLCDIAETIYATEKLWVHQPLDIEKCQAKLVFLNNWPSFVRKRLIVDLYYQAHKTGYEELQHPLLTDPYDADAEDENEIAVIPTIGKISEWDEEELTAWVYTVGENAEIEQAVVAHLVEKIVVNTYGEAASELLNHHKNLTATQIDALVDTIIASSPETFYCDISESAGKILDETQLIKLLKGGVLSVTTFLPPHISEPIVNNLCEQSKTNIESYVEFLDEAATWCLKWLGTYINNVSNSELQQIVEASAFLRHALVELVDGVDKLKYVVLNFPDLSFVTSNTNFDFTAELCEKLLDEFSHLYDRHTDVGYLLEMIETVKDIDNLNTSYFPPPIDLINWWDSRDHHRGYLFVTNMAGSMILKTLQRYSADELAYIREHSDLITSIAQHLGTPHVMLFLHIANREEIKEIYQHPQTNAKIATIGQLEPHRRGKSGVYTILDSIDDQAQAWPPHPHFINELYPIKGFEEPFNLHVHAGLLDNFNSMLGKVEVIKNLKELRQCALMMGNCIFSYQDRIQSGQYLILLLQNNHNSYNLSIKYDKTKQKWAVDELNSRFNKGVDPLVRASVDKVVELFNDHVKKKNM